jgi:hypothetical protein
VEGARVKRDLVTIQEASPPPTVAKETKDPTAIAIAHDVASKAAMLAIGVGVEVRPDN